MKRLNGSFDKYLVVHVEIKKKTKIKKELEGSKLSLRNFKIN